MTADVAFTFLEFVEERHRIWERRQAGAPQPWTDNPILESHKFTNVYRWLDPGSQFVIEELHDPSLSPRDNLMRFFLYRHTGRVETWEWLKLWLGDYPTFDTLDDALAGMKVWRARKRPVFTGAYLVFPQSDTPGTDKLDSIFSLTKRLFDPDSIYDVADTFFKVGSQEARFHALRDNKGVADFMSMQILTDWGYTTEFRENEFVVCGPGAKKGATALGFRDAPAGHRWAYNVVSSLELEAHGRPPSWMDVQNCLCEFSKYVRFAAQGKNGVRYTPAHPGAQKTPTLPRNW